MHVANHQEELIHIVGSENGAADTPRQEAERSDKGVAV